MKDLKPAEYNPRKKLKPGDKEYEKIKNSIEEFGFADPLVVNSDMTVIGGHQRLTVSIDLGYTEVPCAVVDVDKTREKALNIALNKITGAWDENLLADLLKDIEAAEFDVIERQTTDATALNTDEKVTGAGVTAHMNAVLRNALREEPPELKLTNEEEIELLARLITAETGGTDEYLSYLTGSVVINRMKSDKFPNTVFAVIYQKNQYECTWNGHIYKPYTDLAWEIAEELLTYGTTIDESVVYQSEFTQGGGVFQQIGRTYFCYE